MSAMIRENTNLTKPYYYLRKPVFSGTYSAIILP